MPFDVEQVRAQFPALQSGAIYLDNPGGTQVARRVIERMTDYLVRCNANHGGAFRTSIESDAVLHAAHAAMADFLGAASPDEIVFGPNMTTLTFALSRALGRWLQPGDEIVVTHLDHDANIAPWLLLAEDRGAVVRWVDFRPEDCTLDMPDFEAQIGDRTKIVACGYASNAVGTINDVRAIVGMAHAAGALCFVDAVQYAPHGPIDVQALGCDFLVCSAYKFFGPHTGSLYGRYDLLDRLPAYKVRPADPRPPGKFETGTQNHEGQAGTLGAIEYLEWLGAATADGRAPAAVPGDRALGEAKAGGQASGGAGVSSDGMRQSIVGGRPSAVGGRREKLVAAMTALAEYERGLAARLIEGLQAIRGLKIWGITDRGRLAQRVPTVSFTLEGWHPRRLAQRLAEHDIYVWDGNYYALAVTERLGLESQGGMLRVGLAHYNTRTEVDKLLGVLESL